MPAGAPQAVWARLQQASTAAAAADGHLSSAPAYECAFRPDELLIEAKVVYFNTTSHTYAFQLFSAWIAAWIAGFTLIACPLAPLRP
jgi:hypothetical protein